MQLLDGAEQSGRPGSSPQQAVGEQQLSQRHEHLRVPVARGELCLELAEAGTEGLEVSPLVHHPRHALVLKPGWSFSEQQQLQRLLQLRLLVQTVRDVEEGHHLALCWTGIERDGLPGSEPAVTPLLDDQLVGVVDLPGERQRKTLLPQAAQGSQGTIHDFKILLR